MAIINLRLLYVGPPILAISPLSKEVALAVSYLRPKCQSNVILDIIKIDIKTLRVIKTAMNSFSKNLSFGVEFKL